MYFIANILRCGLYLCYYIYRSASHHASRININITITHKPSVPWFRNNNKNSALPLIFWRNLTCTGYGYALYSGSAAISSGRCILIKLELHQAGGFSALA